MKLNGEHYYLLQVVKGIQKLKVIEIIEEANQDKSVGKTNSEN